MRNDGPPYDLIQTNYYTGHYVVLSVISGINGSSRPSCLEELNDSRRKTQPHHMHMTYCNAMNERKKIIYHLNRFIWTAGRRLTPRQKSQLHGRDKREESSGGDDTNLITF